MDPRSEFSLPLLRDDFFADRLTGHTIIDFRVCNVCENSKLTLEYKKLENDKFSLDSPPVCFHCIFAYCARDNGEICGNCVNYGFLDVSLGVGNGKGLCGNCCGKDVKIVDDISEMRNLVSHFSGEQHVDDIMRLVFAKITKSSQTRMVC